MNNKLLVALALTTTCTLSFAQKEMEFRVDLGNLNPVDYVEVSKNQYVYNDNDKTIQVSYGLEGLNHHINYLREEIKTIEASGLSNEKVAHTHNKLISDYEVLNNHKKNLEADLLSKKYSMNNNCYPSLYQDYEFIFHIWPSLGFSVESHYPLVPGPFPPVQQTTIRAYSYLAGNNGYSPISDSSSSTFVGSNISSGTTTAIAAIWGVAPSSTVNWKASSFMFQSNCFESIISSGNL